MSRCARCRWGGGVATCIREGWEMFVIQRYIIGLGEGAADGLKWQVPRLVRGLYFRIYFLHSIGGWATAECATHASATS